MKKPFAFAAISALAGLGALGSLAGSAGAIDTATDANTGYIKQYAISYTSPADSTQPVHKGLPPGLPVDTLCVRKGQTLNGNPYWFLISHEGDLGYVHRDDISAPAETPSC